MNTNKITPYIAAGLVGAGVTFGLCFAFMSKGGNDNKIIGEINQFLKSVDYPFGEGNPEVDSVNGYFSNITDKYTKYIVDADDVTDQTNYINSSGTAAASGFQVDISTDGNILITDITEGLAADLQGLKVDDVITHINGESVSKKGYENFANKILGKDGTKVNLTVRRNGNSFDFEFVRAHYYINNVEFEQMGDVAYMRIRHFDQIMQGQFDEAAEECEKSDKIIIDLRSCPGGEIYATVVLAARLCGKANADQVYFTGETKENNASFPNPRFAGKKVVILVNEKTASSAEIFVANMKNSMDVTLIGKQTFGKGIFQEVHDLSNGAHLKYTAGYTKIEGWDNWHEVGIAPDIEVDMDISLIKTDDDIQLQKAMEFLK